MPDVNWRRLRAAAQAAYVEPQRVDGVRHACPDCDIQHPRPFCPTCFGVGNVTEEQLARWMIRRNTEAIS